MMMNHMCPVHKAAWVLVMVGALNWGLVAVGYNLVDMLLGAGSMAARIVYGLVGLSAIAMLVHGKCKQCMAGGAMKPPAAMAPKM